MTEPLRRYRAIMHVDLDQFQVSVERRGNPELVGVPVIVGGTGDPTEPRKVVTCASYEARDVGVRAGMPLRSAFRKMPDAVYLPLDHASYDAASAEVMSTLRSFGYPVEVIGWDEAFLGVPATESGVDPIGLAQSIRQRILDERGLSSAVGISDNKQRAKMATGFAKRDPEHIFVLNSSNWMPIMGERGVGDLWSVGPKTTAKLEALGISTVEQLAAEDRGRLVAEFGPHLGNWLHLLSRGGGDINVETEPFIPRSHSKVETFPKDLSEPAEIDDAIRKLTRELLAQVVSEDRVAFRVAVTVRTMTFYTRTKSRKLPAPTIDIDVIEPAMLEVLHKFEFDRPIRLLGVRLDLVMPE
ncbi:MAG: DNA polymerase IV [Gordonia sp.]|uniref:DNA-directed DNA polymerase n=1 Tax=Gordonia rubripertincta TaxID=36822 RepID=A0ABT4MXE4_GORRU|nr:MULTISPECIES: DNA polymerase IV [Mycobacteriales]MBA4025919.1 DNA polymerase IV [Gordonia sp. (in: high G+C Gram-positive bacteria)]MCZ4551690.1 DNA polymerase IV [Gordonia rubripertincta]OZG27986.1 DNA polymerase IV [Williamsia sp. 1138]